MVSSVGSKGTQRRVLCPTLLQNRFLCCKNSPLQVLTHILHVQLYILQYCFTNKRESIFFTFEIIPCSLKEHLLYKCTCISKLSIASRFTLESLKVDARFEPRTAVSEDHGEKSFVVSWLLSSFILLKYLILKNLSHENHDFSRRKNLASGVQYRGRCRMHELGKSLGLNLNLPEPV